MFSILQERLQWIWKQNNVAFKSHNKVNKIHCIVGLESCEIKKNLSNISEYTNVNCTQSVHQNMKFKECKKSCVCCVFYVTPCGANNNENN